MNSFAPIAALHDEPSLSRIAGTGPLVVDLDHTLVRGDIAVEAMVRIARSGLGGLIALLVVCCKGRAAVKSWLARRAPVDASALAYDPAVLALIADARAAGRSVILATAAHWRTAHRVAAHLGLFDQIIASSARSNRKGLAKLAAIRALLGDTPFDYVGDSSADRPIWQTAAVAYTVD
ncbi:MAG: haloacid dehalogenase-like hydrolase, partial [Novosphingobium sp.]